MLLLFTTFSTPLRASAHPAAAPLAALTVSIAKDSGAADGAAAWGDFDNDDDLDLLVTGLGNNARRATILFQNTGSTLEPYASGLPAVESSSAEWGDYDNDGYLDVLITGQVGYGSGQIIGLAGVYRNTADPANPARRTFTLTFPLPGIYAGWGTWGDYNSDGRLDILLTGYTSGGVPLTKIYRNNGGPGSTSDVLLPALPPFSDAVSGLTGLGSSTARWGDYNGDDCMDFVIMGRDASGALKTLVYRGTTSGAFYTPVSLTGVWGGAPAWIDIENDGDLDLLVTGNRGDNSANILPTTLLYRYAGGVFSEVSGSGLPNLWETSISVGDYDNDGDADLLMNGLTSTDRPTAVYLNNRNFTFTRSGDALPNGSSLSVAWGDFNKDRSLDAALTGVNVGDVYTTLVYLNSTTPANDAPGAPTLRAACWDTANSLTLEWNSASDQQSITSLTYNLRVGSDPGAIDWVSPEANLASGWQRAAQPGNLSGGNWTTLRGLPLHRTYYWSVQAVDSSLTGGAFSAERRFELGTRVANDNTYTISENSILVFNILENDNQGYAPLVVHSRSSPQHGTLTSLGAGIFIYVPELHWNGTDSFTYYARGATGYCSRATVTINVAAVDYAPEDIQLSNNSLLEDLPAGTTIGAFTTTDRDPEDTHAYTLVKDGPSSLDNDLFQIAGNELQSKVIFDYSPGRTYTINVESRDPDGLTRTERFSINILQNTPVSIACVSGCAGFVSAPKAAHLTMSEDGSPAPFALTLRADDAGAGEILNWSAPTTPARGTLTFAAATTPGANQPVQYTPAADWSGTDSFILRVTDPTGSTDQISVTVDVQPVNDPPSLGAISNQLFVEATGSHAVALNGIGPGPADETGQPITITVETSDPNLLRGLTVEYPGSGPTGVLRFRLEEGTGEASVTITISDGQPENGTRAVTFLVSVVSGPRLFLPIIGRGD